MLKLIFMNTIIIYIYLYIYIQFIVIGVLIILVPSIERQQEIENNKKQSH